MQTPRRTIVPTCSSHSPRNVKFYSLFAMPWVRRINKNNETSCFRSHRSTYSHVSEIQASIRTGTSNADEDDISGFPCQAILFSDTQLSFPLS